MKKLQPMNEILLSWKRCAERRGLSNILYPDCIDYDQLQDILNSYKLLISIFNRSVREVKKKLTGVFFLLTDSNGIVLSKTERVNIEWLKFGTSFAERHCGTNAISMSLMLNKPIFMLPQYNYCDFLKNYSFYAIPISTKKACLSVAVINMILKKEIVVLTDLLKYKIENEYIKYSETNAMQHNIGISLSNRQKEILKLVTLGYTDNNISIDLNLNIGTIRYHKTEIFRKLNVGTSIEAIVKALKLNIIRLDELD